jgi:hypothetical protein
VVEKVSVNGVVVYEGSPKAVVNAVLTSFPDLICWSADGLFLLYNNALALGIEYAALRHQEERGKKRGECTRFINRARRRLIQRRMGRLALLTKIYDEVLANEGKGRLPKFGFCTHFGDLLSGSPEYQTCQEILPFEEDVTMAKKADTPEVSKKELIKAVEELNEVMNPKPPVDTDGTAEVVMEGLLSLAEQIDPDDKVSKATLATIDKARILAAKKPKAKEEEKAEAKEEEKAEEEEEEEKPKKKAAKAKSKDEDEDGEKSLADQVAGGTKLADLKALVGEHDELKGLRKKLDDYKGLDGTRNLKVAMFKALGVEPPKKAAPEKKEKRSKEKTTYGHRVGSQAALIDEALEKGKKLSLKDMAEKAGCTEGRVKLHIKHLQKEHLPSLDVAIKSADKKGGDPVYWVEA